MRKIGNVLIISGFFVWISVLFGNKFMLTEAIFTQKVSVEHQQLLRPLLQDLIGKEYGSVFLFSTKIKNAIEDINAQFDASQSWDKKIYIKYELELSKASAQGFWKEKPEAQWFLCFLPIVLGAFFLFYANLSSTTSGQRNTNIFHHPATSQKWLGVGIGTFLITFYVILYFYPHYLTNWILGLDALSLVLNGGEASQWFLYGFLYTVAVVVMGVRMILKYRDNKYQLVRTSSVMFFQLCIAFLLPELLSKFQLPSADLKNMWPLDYSFFFDYRIDQKIQGGTFGIFLFVWGIALFLVGVPILTYLYGKRWYCSWVCGCGGLAETLGDPFRQLSNKSLKAWQIERYLIHIILVLVTFMTIGVIYSYFTGSYTIAGFIPVESMKYYYGFFVGSIFSGVIGTGFYPLMGNRVWCRFGCPLAAYMGIIQRYKSRYRITTNGGQCISCGNCSTYCEQGIDVRAYAQKGQDIVRASCVGCGICSAVCPRGVLKLENSDEKASISL
ncbi:MAG: 4Fe-4S binding protein [Spirosomataceae bacterium]